MPQAVLIKDDWNDFGFVTTFDLVVYLAVGKRRPIGKVKIGASGMTPTRNNVVDLPVGFERLDDDHFSVGQDDTYYERLGQCSDHVRVAVLTALRDMAFDAGAFERAQGQEVTRTSLLRFVTAASVETQFRRIAGGGDRVAGFRVEYELPASGGAQVQPTAISFEIAPMSRPSTNIHALTGRNGVGKSHLLNNLTLAVGDRSAAAHQHGRVVERGRGALGSFANLVSVTFSAFDPFAPIPSVRQSIDYAYVGLKVPSDSSNRSLRVKTPGALARDFAESVEACLTGARAERWATALATLLRAGIAALDSAWIDEFRLVDDPVRRRQQAKRLFAQLSAGHKIVLLTMTRLVQHVSERSLVVIDEPEAHLHPPLLAAFIRALSDLLTERNGLALIATHSPVVLQEIPRTCVWKVQRFGPHPLFSRPSIETFGENVGVLTHEIFGLEVTDSGFHRDLSEAVDDGLSYEEALERFDGQLGGEARAILRSLVLARQAEGNS